MSAITHKLATGTVLPYKWEPYPYQDRALARYFGTDGAPAQTRQIHVWSRRLGKDRFAMELAALASQFRVMNIWHLFPLHKQARVAIWNGIDPATGMRFLDQTFPVDMVARRSDAQMMLEFCNGSTYQMLGSDSYNSVVGSNPGLVIFSEYALSDPLAWAYISPIIRQNGGGAVFISTYRGRNHHFKLVQQVTGNPEWFISHEDVDSALKADGSPVYPRADAEQELVHMDRARWLEEFKNQPCVTLEGAYFARELSDAQAMGRSCSSELYLDGEPIACAWAWAKSHHVWAVLFQVSDGRVRIIGARHWSFTEPVYCMSELAGSLPYSIEKHLLPPQSRDGVPGETIEEKFEEMMPGLTYTALDADIFAGIDSVRRMLPSVSFGREPGCEDYFDALTEFRSASQRLDGDELAVSSQPVKDSGLVAAQALMAIADFRASGEPIRSEPCLLDWSKRNLRRRFA